MPLPHLKKQCTATCRATGERCKNPAAYGMKTCRYHGARKPETVRKGPNHPAYRSGRFTQATQTENRHYLTRLREIEANLFALGHIKEPKRVGRPMKTNINLSKERNKK